MTFRRIVLSALIVFSSIAGAQAQQSETERLNAWFEQKFEEQLDFSPMMKTTLGRKDDYDRLDDVSEAALDEQLEWKRASVRELRETFDYELLTPEARTSWDLWVYQLEQAEAARPFRRRSYLFHQMGGAHTRLPQFLINFHRVDDESDMRAYISRIGEAARMLRQTLERAEHAAAERVHAPRFAYEAVISQSRAVVTGQPFDQAEGAPPSPLWADVEAKLAGLVDAGEIDEARAGALKAEAAEALRGSFGPAYEALIAWAESELERTDADATGVWKLPDGEAYYRERLVANTTTDMTADEIHALGLAEVARIQDEMREVMDDVGFDGSLDEFFVFFRTDPQFVYPSTDEGREAYLQAARDHLEAIEDRLPEYFGLLPKAGLEVRRVESFREEPGAAQHYVQGTPDGSRPGVYYAHLIDMSSMPIPDLEVVAYHEGLPGHHMQIAIAQELEGVPTFRTQIGFNAYIEGWALYSESLAREMGAYEDPYSNFGALSAEIWRAIRLVVDTGLHAQGWTQEEAVQYFTDNSPVSEGQIRSEIERYIVMPGQATGYKIGMIRIQELRGRAEAELGDDFDIRGFHDTVLGGGALPLSILKQRVEDWIEARK
ncbi:MAG TPA: DUF885 domain-containing protein [Gammaproteobacteria bacterium]|nr:DUF885 domain-containing protein [Gammaproteobacteria bacterium]